MSRRTCSAVAGAALGEVPVLGQRLGLQRRGEQSLRDGVVQVAREAARAPPGGLLVELRGHGLDGDRELLDLARTVGRERDPALAGRDELDPGAEA